MACQHCEKDAICRCVVCGSPICADHVKLRTLCQLCIEKRRFKYTIAKATSDAEKRRIGKLVERFWGEQVQLTHDRRFVVAELLAYTASVGNDVVGFVSYAEVRSAIMIVALGVLPGYQASGIGGDLVRKVVSEGVRMRKKELLVSTSNDDLPALAFYQSLGFQIYEVKPNVIAEKHGAVLKGIGGLPMRDELRLYRPLRI